MNYDKKQALFNALTDDGIDQLRDDIRRALDRWESRPRFHRFDEVEHLCGIELTPRQRCHIVYAVADSGGSLDFGHTMLVAALKEVRSRGAYLVQVAERALAEVERDHADYTASINGGDRYSESEGY